MAMHLFPLVPDCTLVSNEAIAAITRVCHCAALLLYGHRRVASAAILSA